MRRQLDSRGMFGVLPRGPVEAECSLRARGILSSKCCEETKSDGFRETAHTAPRLIYTGCGGAPPVYIFMAHLSDFRI